MNKNVLMFGTGVFLGVYGFMYVFNRRLFERIKDGTAYMYFRNGNEIYEYGTNPMTDPESKQDKQEEQEVPE